MRFLDTTCGASGPGRGCPRTTTCRRDGTIVDVEVTADDVDLGGRACRVCLCQDVTERNRATAELLAAREELRARAEERYRLLFEHNPQPMIVYDRDDASDRRRLRRARRDATALARGVPRDDDPRPRPATSTATAADFLAATPALRGEPPGRSSRARRRHRCKDGTIIDVEVTSDDVMLGGRECRVALCLDVTRAQPGRGGARGRARRGGRGVAHEVRVPRQHEPRDPHADERRDRA